MGANLVGKKTKERSTGRDSIVHDYTCECGYAHQETGVRIAITPIVKHWIKYLREKVEGFIPGRRQCLLVGFRFELLLVERGCDDAVRVRSA